ncbi:hypothetical protein KQ874_02995 [Mycoplasma sp. ES3157-GEN-MYC]|uniref:Uncharacterized protein n=1 Tax=Mycoplasma miroungigenitalium TaxID=754515 RepID=A0A6M4JBX4_9MOLU|nr:hypothetical protein [Mycoplasma miroungigenitalium]MBU4690644.1 hypothetical protein [Mycoplasma miroungigenitalium]MBU4691912.1 hypothetical protein [Mycoplasma miroungigenitalium]QJR43768.1 hypothetical protein HLA87_03200 [Mycoplasma miroungigenitalium]
MNQTYTQHLTPSNISTISRINENYVADFNKNIDLLSSLKEKSNYKKSIIILDGTIEQLVEKHFTPDLCNKFIKLALQSLDHEYVINIDHFIRTIYFKQDFSSIIVDLDNSLPKTIFTWFLNSKTSLTMIWNLMVYQAIINKDIQTFTNAGLSEIEAIRITNNSKLTQKASWVLENNQTEPVDKFVFNIYDKNTLNKAVYVM